MKMEIFSERTINNADTAEKKCSMRYKVIIRQVSASFSFSLVCLSYGMAYAFTGTLLPRIRDFVDEKDGTWLAATNMFSIVIGAYASIFIIPFLGYKIGLIFAEILSFVGWLCLSFARHFLIFDLGCVLLGFSSGYAYQISLTCRAEIPESGIRGIISATITTSYQVGVLVGHVLAIMLPWRIALKSCSLLPLLAATFSLFLLPESPSWLLYKGRLKEAQQVFQRLRGETSESQQEFKFMQEKQSILRERGILGTFKTTCTKEFVVSFIIGSVLLTAQSISGCDIMAIYSVDLLSHMSSLLRPDNATILFDLVSVVSSLVSCYVVKKTSRRGLLLGSTVGTVVLLILLMVMSVYQFSAAVFALCLCAYSALLNVGLIPLSWLLLTEVFSEPNRDIGICLTTGYFNFLTFILTKLIPIIESVGGIVSVLGFFTITLSLTLIVLFFIVPETKELPLREIEAVIHQGKLYRFVSYLAGKNTANKTKQLNT